MSLLESHLYDAMDELQQLGLSIEESFLIAQKRLGKTKELTSEYGKVNTKIYFINKLTPYLKGILLFMAFTTLTNLLVNAALMIASNLGLAMQSLQYVSIGTLIMASLVLVLIGYRVYKNMRLLTKLTAIPTLISVILIGKLATVFSTPYMLRSGAISMFDYGNLQANITIYNLIFGLCILLFSFAVFYRSKRAHNIKISE
jgi:hypothetical protein